MRRFGVFELDSFTGELRKRGARVRLQEQPFRILEALLERPGELVGREELKVRLWPNDPAYRTDDNLNRAVTRLRESLGDSADRPRFVEGIRQRGYRFVAPVERNAEIRVTVDHRAATAFVGREEERRYLDQVLRRARGGHGNLLFIGGEPGVGKTRLAEELLQSADREGAYASYGRCYESEGAPPFICFTELVERSARRMDPNQLREHLGPRAPEVARLVPELSRVLTDIPPLPELPPELQRRNLFNGFLEFLARWSRASPLVLLLDDLHSADPSTLALVDHLAEHIPSLPVLVLATYRDTEIDARPRFARSLQELVRKRLGERLSLKRFGRSEVREVLRLRQGAAPPDELVEKLFRFTDGNPFYIEEVLQDHESGASDWNVPENVRLVTFRRLERLSQECFRLLQTASVIGRDFSVELLDALELERIVECLEESERARLIRFDSNGREARYVFEHELIRQTLLTAMNLSRRQRHHLKIADALERVSGNSRAEVAHHLLRAGSLAPSARVVESLLGAAEDVLSSTAVEDALRYADAGLAVEASDEPRLQARLRYVRGLALWALQRWEEASEEWARALPLFESLGDVPGVSKVSRSMSIPLMWTGRFDEVSSLLTRVEASIGTRATEHRCLLLCGRAMGLGFGPAADYVEAERALEEAESIAKTVGTPELEGVARMQRAVLHSHHEDHRLAADEGERAASILRPTRNLIDYAPTLAYLQAARLSLGELSAVDAMAEEVESLARRIGHRNALALAERNRAIAGWMRTGNLDAQEAHFRRGIELMGLLGGFGLNEPYVRLGLVQFWKGEWRAALDSMDEALSLEKDDLWFGSAVGGRVLIGAYLGRGDVLHVYQENRSRLPMPGRPARTGPWQMLVRVIEGLAVLGELNEAAELYLVARELADRGAAVLLWSETLVQKAAAIAAAAGGHWEAAEMHFEAALRHADEIPVRIEQPEVRRWYAWCLNRRKREGDAAKANRLLLEALELYQTIGMPRHAELARQSRSPSGIGQVARKTR